MADISLKIKSDFAQAEKDFKSLNMTTQNVSKQMEKFRSQFKTEQIDKFIERNKLNASAIRATQGPLASVTAETKGLQRQIETLIKKGLSPESAEIKKLQGEYIRSSNELGKMSKATDKTTSSFKSSITTVGMLAAAYGALRGISGIIGSIITEARNLEDAEAAFTPLMGGAERAKELVKELNIAAAETPFQFQDIQKSVSTLLPTMNGDIQKTVDTFKMLGDTAGGNAQKLDSITRGFSKAMLKGKVDMESLNMIAEAGVPIFNEMAQVMGYGEDNMSAFFKEISSGKVSTDVMIETFRKMTSEGGLFFEGMIIASKTTSGVISSLQDNLAMTGAAIGQQFLPYIKEAALGVISVSSSVLKWITTGDNLKEMISTIGYVIAGATAGFIAYAIASGGAATATLAAAGAVKAFTLALAANPLTALAVLITAVIVPAIIYMVKNWDTVKWKIIDFAQTANIKMMELGLAIREKVMGAINALLKQLAKIPKIGDTFKGLAEGNDRTTASIKRQIEVEKAKQKGMRQVAKYAQEQAAAEIKANEEKAKSYQDINSQIGQAEKARQEATKQGLNEVVQAEAQNNNQRLENMVQFFEQKAEVEGINAEERLEWLQQQNEVIKNMETMNNEEKLMAEKALRIATENEQRKLSQARIQFAQDALSTTGAMLTDLQTVFKNAGKESRGLAIALKAIAMAEAGINSYLAFTKALAAYPPPFNYIAAGITLAAGLAKQAAIGSTPIPSAETGLSNFTVPETRGTRNDGAAVMAQGGETVSVTPRGEDASQTTDIRIQIEEETIFRVVQRGIRTGKINVSNRNLGAGVFV